MFLASKHTYKVCKWWLTARLHSAWEHHLSLKTQTVNKSCLSFMCSHLFFSFLLQPSPDVYVKVLAGDEVIQVNDQIVVSVAYINLCVCSISSLRCIHVILSVWGLAFTLNLLFLQKWNGDLWPGIFTCPAASGGLEQSCPCEEAAGEPQRSDSGPEEDSRVSETQTSVPALLHTGQRNHSLHQLYQLLSAGELNALIFWLNSSGLCYPVTFVWMYWRPPEVYDSPFTSTWLAVLKILG